MFSKNRRKILPDIKDLVPLGIDGQKSFQLFARGLLFFFLFSLFYLLALWNGYNAWKDPSSRTVIPVFWEMSFRYLVPIVLYGFLCLVFHTLYHLWYHRKGSRSDYTMRRLPDVHEYQRRLAGLPLLEFAICLALAAILSLLYYRAYLAAIMMLP